MSTLISGKQLDEVSMLGWTRELISLRTGLVVTILITLALVYWLWYGLTQRSITGDDGISILAAQGILEHGYPQLPSGFIYYRGYIPNYLVAGSILAFGLNDFGIMLPGLFMSLGSLVLTYLFAKDVLGRPLVGLASVALLILLDVQTFYATSPRMYMFLQFFTVLSAYSAWRGYIKGEGKFQWIAVLALLGALLSHKQGGALLIAVPMAVVTVRWFQGKERSPINYRLALASYAVLWVLFLFPFLYSLPNGVPLIAAHGGVNLHHAGLNLDFVGWLKQIFNLERSLPFGLCLVPLLLALVYHSYRRRHDLSNRGTIYTFISFAACALATILIVEAADTRFWLMILPFYALLLCSGIAMLISMFKEAPSQKQSILSGKPSLILLACITWSAIIFLVSFLAYSPNGYIVLAEKAYGMPCVEQDIECSKVVKEQYNSVSPLIREGDIVVSSNPSVTYYYLGRVDFFLRQFGGGGSFTSFDRGQTNEYLGIPFADSLEKLTKLHESDQRVWVFADFKAHEFVDEDIYNLLVQRYAKYNVGTAMTVYVNH